MPRKKLRRFAQALQMPHILVPSQEDFLERLQDFCAGASVTLELGCGRGEHTVSLAERFPDCRYIGIDYQGERLWYGAKECGDAGLDNALFLQMRVEQILDFFPPQSVGEIIIPFSDPFPKKRHEKHRLTSSRFLEMYRSLLVPGGKVHFKTDNATLFAYSQESIRASGGVIEEVINSVPSDGAHNPILQVHSRYERVHRDEGDDIGYLRFGFLD